jgi:RNA 3'-terminal phosphate cyclase (ATP)
LLKIDGSYGEGGGQLLRTSLSLSCLLGVPFHLSNIRLKRPKPGLQPQHLTCVLAAQQISGANVEGAHLNSTSLSFTPTLRSAGGQFNFDVSKISPSAGSTSLILQTILPPLAFAPTPSTITLKGGTHVPFSPVFEYIQQVFLPSLSALGLDVTVKIESAGFYPLGGGRIEAQVNPAERLLAPGEITRGRLKEVACFSLVSRLPLSIAQRQMQAVIASLRPAAKVPRQDVFELPSPGAGTSAFILARFEGLPAGFSSLGRRGKPAEQVGSEAAESAKTFLACGAALDMHLADQLLLWLCLSKGRFQAQVEKVTEHLLTNLWVVKQFLPVEVQVSGQPDEMGLLVGEGIGFAR